MGVIVEFFLDIILKGLIVQFFGLYPRYYFFKLIGKEKDIKYLSGEKKLHDSTDKIQQPIFNAVIGLIIFALVVYLIAYIVYS